MVLLDVIWLKIGGENGGYKWKVFVSKKDSL